MRPNLPPLSADTANGAAGDAAGNEPLVILESDAGREAFLARAERLLPEGEAIVRVKDLVGMRRAFRTVPTHPQARLVAQEVPTVLRGGLTSLVSYYRVPLDGLEAVETHYENGALSHTYDVILSVARVGKAPRREAALAA